MTRSAVLVILSLSFVLISSAQEAHQAIILRPVASVALWPEGKMPRHGAAEPEGDLPARSDGFRRTTNVSRPTLTIYPWPTGSSSDITSTPTGDVTATPIRSSPRPPRARTASYLWATR